MSDQPGAAPVSTSPPKGSGAFFWLSLVVFLIGAGGFAWIRYTNSISYKVRQDLSLAEKRIRDGKAGEAARIYRNLADDSSQHASEALDRFKDLLGKPLDTASLEEVQAVLVAGWSWPEQPELHAQLAERGMELVRGRGDKDPTQAVALLRLIFEHTGEQKKRQELSSEAAKLLESWSKTHPDNIEVAVSYAAEVLRHRNDARGVEKLLAPLRERLKGHNGEAVLAWSYASQGKLDEAIPLLEQFCKERLPLYLKADQKADKLMREAQGPLMLAIDQRKADGFDYGAYDGTDELGKQRLKFQYLEAYFQKDAEIHAARTERARQEIVAQSVVDLAQLQLSKARSLPDAERQAMIGQAEKTFRNLRDTSREHFSSHLNLAQAAFWMGKPKEAQKYIDEMLERAGRSPGILIEAAKGLRGLGDLLQARKLVEEAYEKVPDKRMKEEVALIRARMGDGDVADEIVWLKKLDRSLPTVQMLLSQALARQAEEEGRYEEGAAHLRESLKLFDKLPKVPGTTYEEGLVWLGLFRLNRGEKAALDKALALFEKAVTAQPDNAVLLHNAALHLYQSACLDLTLGGIDVEVLRERDGLDNLAYRYSESAEREQQAARARQHPGLSKAVEWLEKLRALQPRNSTAYELLVPLHMLNHDLKALQAMANQVKDFQHDESDVGKALEPYFSKQDETFRQARARAIQRWEKLVTQMSDKKASRSLAAALVGLVRVMMRGGEVGDPPDADRALKLAEEAAVLLPSRMTEQKLIDALLHRAHRQLIASDPEYKKMAERAKRSLNPSLLVALALTREGPTKALAAANADIVRVGKLLKARSEAFPDEPGPWQHAMLQATQPEAAAKMALALKTDEPNRLALAISLKLKPLSLPEAVEQFWMLRLEGKQKEGEALLRSLGERGVPLPFDVK